MKPYYSDDSVTLYHGDMREVLRELSDASVDAVVTDPPYGLEFMGKEWDGADGFRRSLNPADAGRDSVFGRTSRTSPEYRTGKPSNARIRTRVDGRTNPAEGKSVTTTPEAYVAGPVFQQWCQAWATECLRVLKPGGHLLAFGGTRTVHRLTVGIEDAGFEIRDGIDWLYGSGFPKSMNLGDGRGTALKPAREPIVMARKPLAGSVAANVATHGTGALNIDDCRVATDDVLHGSGKAPLSFGGANHRPYHDREARPAVQHIGGRWPANVVLSHLPDCAEACPPGCPVAELDRQSGVTTSAGGSRGAGGQHGTYGRIGAQPDVKPGFGDVGGASRFFPAFRYEPKAAAAERPRTADGTAHPTVKPLALMRWLVRLVTPAGAVVLDPFAGSGTTAEACVREGRRCITVERDDAYLPLITSRLARPIQGALDFGELAS